MHVLSPPRGATAVYKGYKIRTMGGMPGFAVKMIYIQSKFFEKFIFVGVYQEWGTRDSDPRFI